MGIANNPVGGILGRNRRPSKCNEPHMWSYCQDNKWYRSSKKRKEVFTCCISTSAKIRDLFKIFEFPLSRQSLECNISNDSRHHRDRDQNSKLP